MPELSDATIGILTALPYEYAAVCGVLGLTQDIASPPVNKTRQTYKIGEIQSRYGGTHVVVAALLPKMGNNLAASCTTLLTEHCINLDSIVMCGIAGAVPNMEKVDDHVRLGDIVVSNEKGVVQYDFIKQHKDFEEHRHSNNQPSAQLLSATRILQADAEVGDWRWKESLERFISSAGTNWQRPGSEKDILNEGNGVHPEDPQRNQIASRVFYGPIASANKVLTDPEVRNKLRDSFQVKAVEMEGSGVSDATWVSGRGYIVIRGICDYCNPDKADGWHHYAAAIAAAYTRSLIESVPTVTLTESPVKTVAPPTTSEENYVFSPKSMELMLEQQKKIAKYEMVMEAQDASPQQQQDINTLRVSENDIRDAFQEIKNVESNEKVVDGYCNQVERVQMLKDTSNDESASIELPSTVETQYAQEQYSKLTRLRSTYEFETLKKLAVEIGAWLEENEEKVDALVLFDLFEMLSTVEAIKAKNSDDNQREVYTERAHYYLEKAKSCLN